MNELASTEFRRTYARLTARTKVTVNGHVIGVWTPGAPLYEGEPYPPVVQPVKPIKGASQKERDDFLRRINQG